MDFNPRHRKPVTHWGWYAVANLRRAKSDQHRLSLQLAACLPIKQINDRDCEKRGWCLTGSNLPAIVNGKDPKRFGFDPGYHGVSRRHDGGYYLSPASQFPAVVFKNSSADKPRDFQRKRPARPFERQLPHRDAPADAVRTQSSLCVSDRDSALREERQWFDPKLSLRGIADLRH